VHTGEFIVFFGFFGFFFGAVAAGEDWVRTCEIAFGVYTYALVVSL
jgi:hypothetical protein